MKLPRVYTRGIIHFIGAESAETPSLPTPPKRPLRLRGPDAFQASEGPPCAFIHGLTPVVLCEGG